MLELLVFLLIIGSSCGLQVWLIWAMFWLVFLFVG